MAEKEQNASGVKLVRCTLSSSGNRVSIGTDMIVSFTVHESVQSPFMGASLIVSDSANLLNDLPIQGGEDVEIQLKHTFDDAPVVYRFKVYKIAGRFVKNKQQIYNLGLISSEALLNETIRVQQALKGNPEAIIQKLLGNEYLDSAKTFYSEPSRFEVNMIANRRRPFDIIAKLLSKSVSPKTQYGLSNNDNKNKSEQQVKGSAGFYFWETIRGYNFFSIDALCDVPKKDESGKIIEGSQQFAAPRLRSESWGPYKEGIGNQDGVGDQRFLIENIAFSSEVDLMQSLRKGKYSSLMVFYNYSTGQYEEYVYKVKDSYDNMAHLGGQESISLIPTNQIELSDYPSRIMSVLLDHESWYNDPGIANPEDPKAKDPTKFADWQKYYAAQSTARAELLKNQEAVVQIPGNPQICAGDKIDLILVSKLSDALRSKEPIDKESSGIYLINEATHTFNFLEGANGTVKTTLRLFRDSYGLADGSSNRGTK